VGASVYSRPAFAQMDKRATRPYRLVASLLRE
jgi:hypothetical protein